MENLWNFIFLSLLHGAWCITSDRFNEELLIKPFSSGHILTYFHFKTQWDIVSFDSPSASHYNLFPKSLGEILKEYRIQELHLTLTHGHWRYSRWGYPLTDSPSGAQLWVWFDHDAKNIDFLWSSLNNALSGAFCASLNFMDTKSTTSPHITFRPTGAYSSEKSFVVSQAAKYSKTRTNTFNKYIKYSALPREIVCTENLTPWIKLLPCSNNAGFATLLNAVKLYDSSFHSLALHVRPVCRTPKCSETSIELSQSVSVVFDRVNENIGRQDWSFTHLFGRPLASACSVAETSQIFIDLTENATLSFGNSFSLTPKPSRILSSEQVSSKLPHKQYAVYDVISSRDNFVTDEDIKIDDRNNNSAFNLLQYKPTRSAPLQIGARFTNRFVGHSISPPQLHVHRYATGYGQEKGGLTTHLHNNSPTKSLQVILLETIPWYFRVYYHTLRVEREGKLVKPLRLFYTPGKDRKRSYQIEIALELPPQSTTYLSYSFQKALLIWTEYPPDANHGFYIPSGVVTALITDPGLNYTQPPLSDNSILASLFLYDDTDNGSAFPIRIYTESILVSLPTPDFSMPYNVICFTCTALAIAFGSFHSLTTKEFKIVDSSKEKNKKGLLKKIQTYFLKLIGRQPNEMENPSQQQKGHHSSSNIQNKDTKDNNIQATSSENDAEFPELEKIMEDNGTLSTSSGSCQTTPLHLAHQQSRVGEKVEDNNKEMKDEKLDKKKELLFGCKSVDFW